MNLVLTFNSFQFYKMDLGAIISDGGEMGIDFIVEPDETVPPLLGQALTTGAEHVAEFCGTWPSRQIGNRRETPGTLRRAYRRAKKYVLGYDDGEVEPDAAAIIQKDNVMTQLAKENAIIIQDDIPTISENVARPMEDCPTTSYSRAGESRQMSPREMARGRAMTSITVPDEYIRIGDNVVVHSAEDNIPDNIDHRPALTSLSQALKRPLTVHSPFGDVHPDNAVEGQEALVGGLGQPKDNAPYSHFKIMINKVSRANIRMTAMMFSSYDLIHCGYHGYSVVGRDDNHGIGHNNGIYLVYTRAKFEGSTSLPMVEAARLSLDDIAAQYPFIFPVYVICIEHKLNLNKFAPISLLLLNTVLACPQPLPTVLYSLAASRKRPNFI